MSSLKELKEVGQSLGLDGDKLLGFVREEQAKERQDRLEAREVEKEKADSGCCRQRQGTEQR